MRALEVEVKQLIIDVLNLEDMTVEDIETSAPLFASDDGLGLDSIDALELGVALKKQYNITISSEDDGTHKHFESVASLVAFISKNSKG